MDQATVDRLAERARQQMRERFPDAPISQVDVLQYGDDPEVEPGQLLLRVTIEAPADKKGRLDALETFHDTHREAFASLRRDLEHIHEVGLLEFVAGEGGDHG